MPKISLNNVVQADIRKLIGTRAHNSGALATGGTTTKIALGATTTYQIDGVWYSKSNTDDLFVLPLTVNVIQPGSAAPALPVSSAFGGAGLGVVTRYVFCGLDSAGAGYAYLSDAPSAADADQTDGSTIPDIPDTVCIVGYAKIVTAANTIFTPRTTVLGTGNTVTYVNCSPIPSTLV